MGDSQLDTCTNICIPKALIGFVLSYKIPQIDSHLIRQSLNNLHHLLIPLRLTSSFVAASFPHCTQATVAQTSMTQSASFFPLPGVEVGS
jgi:hypothetical protein